MYIWRAEIHVKTGCMQELMSKIKEPWETIGGTFLIPLTGCAEVFEVYFEAETLGEKEQAFADIIQSRVTFPKDKLTEQFDELITSITFSILAKV